MNKIDDTTIAKNIKFDTLKLQFKNTELEFEEINFKTIYKIDNLKTFWEVYQTLEFPELILKGSIFLSLKTPIWNPSYGTYSFIVSQSSKKMIFEVFTDISLFFLENQLNENKKIESVSLSLKGRERNIFNIKVTLNSQNPHDVCFESLPEYFGSPKFSLNCERSSSGFELVKRNKYNNNNNNNNNNNHQYSNKNYYNKNYNKKNHIKYKKKNQQQQNNKPPLINK